MYFKHVRSLSFNQTTNYGYLHDLFSKLLRRKGCDYDYVFDVAELKFLERLQGKEKNIWGGMKFLAAEAICARLDWLSK